MALRARGAESDTGLTMASLRSASRRMMDVVVRLSSERGRLKALLTRCVGVPPPPPLPVCPHGERKVAGKRKLSRAPSPPVNPASFLCLEVDRCRSWSKAAGSRDILPSSPSCSSTTCSRPSRLPSIDSGSSRSVFLVTTIPPLCLGRFRIVRRRLRNRSWYAPGSTALMPSASFLMQEVFTSRSARLLRSQPWRTSMMPR
mmetsp:Transcript_30092/g.87648  ORF Transcript_30092/g.87648 Transcript_30092/m.87648 type:complete len:201 (-) Transcript_30092:333-935(-)